MNCGKVLSHSQVRRKLEYTLAASTSSSSSSEGGKMLQMNAVKQMKILGGSPGLVVMGDNSCLRGCGFKSLRHILDGHGIFFIDLL